MTKKEILFDFFGIAAQKIEKLFGFLLLIKFILAVTTVRLTETMIHVTP